MNSSKLLTASALIGTLGLGISNAAADDGVVNLCAQDTNDKQELVLGCFTGAETIEQQKEDIYNVLFQLQSGYRVLVTQLLNDLNANGANPKALTVNDFKSTLLYFDPKLVKEVIRDRFNGVYDSPQVQIIIYDSGEAIQNLLSESGIATNPDDANTAVGATFNTAEESNTPTSQFVLTTDDNIREIITDASGNQTVGKPIYKSGEAGGKAGDSYDLVEKKSVKNGKGTIYHKIQLPEGRIAAVFPTSGKITKPIENSFQSELPATVTTIPSVNYTPDVIQKTIAALKQSKDQNKYLFDTFLPAFDPNATGAENLLKGIFQAFPSRGLDISSHTVSLDGYIAVIHSSNQAYGDTSPNHAGDPNIIYADNGYYIAIDFMIPGKPTIKLARASDQSSKIIHTKRLTPSVAETVLHNENTWTSLNNEVKTDIETAQQASQLFAEILEDDNGHFFTLRGKDALNNTVALLRVDLTSIFPAIPQARTRETITDDDIFDAIISQNTDITAPQKTFIEEQKNKNTPWWKDLTIAILDLLFPPVKAAEKEESDVNDDRGFAEDRPKELQENPITQLKTNIDTVIADTDFMNTLVKNNDPESLGKNFQLGVLTQALRTMYPDLSEISDIVERAKTDNILDNHSNFTTEICNYVKKSAENYIQSIRGEWPFWLKILYGLGGLGVGGIIIWGGVNIYRRREYKNGLIGESFNEGTRGSADPNNPVRIASTTIIT